MAVELIAVLLVLGCVDRFGGHSRNLVREHLPVGGNAGASDLRQCRNASSTVTRSAEIGGLPCTDSGASPQRLIHARHEEQQADPRLLDHILQRADLIVPRTVGQQQRVCVRRLGTLRIGPG